MFQLVSIASWPVAVHLQEKSGFVFSVSSNQIAADSNSVSPEPSLLQTQHISVCPSSLATLMASAGWTCSSASLFLVLSRPKLDTVPQTWSHKCQIERKDHFSGPACYTFSSAAQVVVGFLCCKDTLPIHVQLAVHHVP